MMHPLLRPKRRILPRDPSLFPPFELKRGAEPSTSTPTAKTSCAATPLLSQKAAFGGALHRICIASGLLGIPSGTSAVAATPLLCGQGPTCASCERFVYDSTRDEIVKTTQIITLTRIVAYRITRDLLPYGRCVRGLRAVHGGSVHHEPLRTAAECLSCTGKHHCDTKHITSTRTMHHGSLECAPGATTTPAQTP